MPESNETERLLERVLCGDLAEDAPEVRDLLAADPQAAEALRRLKRLQARLDEQGAIERNELQEALQQASPLESFVAPAFERARSGKPRTALRWLIAVAALLVVALAVWATRNPQPTRTTPDANYVLGSSSDGREMRRVDRDGRFVGLAWDAAAGAARYRLVIFVDESVGASAYRPLVEHDAEDGLSWTLRASELTKLDGFARVRCELRAMDDNDDQVATRDVTVELDP